MAETLSSFEPQWQNVGPGGARLQRGFDIAVATLALVFMFVPLVGMMTAIRATSPGPAFFRQTRVGRNGRTFQIYKFRTMAHDRPAPGPSLTLGEDSRVTPLGGLLRKWKIDELPQLINVLCGEMSLVGPRPELPEFVAKYRGEDQRIVLSVAPGLTDFASIRFRNESDLLAMHADPIRYYEDVVLSQKLRYARFYVARASLGLNIYILAQTISVIAGDFFAKGRRKPWCDQARFNAQRRTLPLEG
jgi:lipopolysaccharide/colanic/teichoic acid biosynthesis glycosyltransferase